VYESPRLDVAKMDLDDLVVEWGKIYPRVVDSWIKSDHLFTYFNYPNLFGNRFIQRTGSRVLAF